MVTTLALYEPDGQFAGILEKVTDITTLHRAQVELNRSNDRMRKTMGAVIQTISLTIEKREPLYRRPPAPGGQIVPGHRH